jgi:hypothetical protein
MLRALEQHWPDYLAEALGLGLFMFSACVFGTLIGHPDSPAARLIPDGLLRRLLMGLAMGRPRRRVRGAQLSVKSRCQVARQLLPQGHARAVQP